MGMWYRLLDYQNGRIVQCASVAAVCMTIKALFPAYTSSFDIVSANNEFVTKDFTQSDYGDWVHNPQARPSRED